MVCNPRLSDVILESGNVRGEWGFKGSVVLGDYPFVG